MTMLKRTLLSVQATPDVSNIRTAELFNEEHTVVPVVALVEGVLWPANAEAPELALAEEFGRFPEGWDGRPVVFDHPRINGRPVSASNPSILEDVAFGQLFNTCLEDGKLKSEIWINNARVERMSEEVQDAVKRLTSGDDVVEVSTGLFTLTEQVKGTFGGEEFEAIWRNVVPDHLAVLPEGITGACSVEDGCGAPRENKEFVPVMNSAKIQVYGSESGTQGCSTCEGACACDTEKKGRFQKIMETMGNIFAFRDSAENISDADIRTAIAAELANTEDFFWIMAVFDHGDGTGTFVYESFMAGKLYQQEFNVSEDGVSIGEERTEVRPVTQFVPVKSSQSDVTDNADANAEATSTQEKSTMDKDQLVQGLIDNASTQFSEDDRDWLSTLEESQLAKLSPTNNEGDGEEEEVPLAAAEEEEETTEVEEPSNNKRVTTEEYIANAPDEVREVLDESLRMHRSRKSSLIKGIMANSRNKFTEAQLKSKGLGELEAIAELATDVSYEGASPLLSAQSRGDDDGVPAPIPLFDLNKKSA